MSLAKHGLLLRYGYKDRKQNPTRFLPSPELPELSLAFISPHHLLYSKVSHCSTVPKRCSLAYSLQFPTDFIINSGRIFSKVFPHLAAVGRVTRFLDASPVLKANDESGIGGGVFEGPARYDGVLIVGTMNVWKNVGVGDVKYGPVPCRHYGFSTRRRNNVVCHELFDAFAPGCEGHRFRALRRVWNIRSPNTNSFCKPKSVSDDRVKQHFSGGHMSLVCPSEPRNISRNPTVVTWLNYTVPCCLR
jgi:hypothetical protein